MIHLIILSHNHLVQTTVKISKNGIFLDVQDKNNSSYLTLGASNMLATQPSLTVSFLPVLVGDLHTKSSGFAKNSSASKAALNDTRSTIGALERRTSQLPCHC